MTSIGGLASCSTLSCNTLIADEIDTINTSKNINMTKDGVIRWSLGLDDNNNFVLQNEVADVEASIIANNDTGVVTILGGGGGGGSSTLIDLTDVVTTDISNNDIMYYDSADSKFKFSDTINVSTVNFTENIKLSIDGSNPKISIGGSMDYPNVDQSKNSIAIGYNAGWDKLGEDSIAIGQYSAFSNSGNDCIAIGNNAGNTNLGNFSIAIGKYAARTSTGFPIKHNSIMLNATEVLTLILLNHHNLSSPL